LPGDRVFQLLRVDLDGRRSSSQEVLVPCHNSALQRPGSTAFRQLGDDFPRHHLCPLKLAVGWIRFLGGVPQLPEGRPLKPATRDGKANDLFFKPERRLQEETAPKKNP
jgi:hypothetical protein